MRASGKGLGNTVESLQESESWVFPLAEEAKSSGYSSRFHVNDHSKTTEREGGEDRVKGWVGSWVEGNKKYVLICLSLLCDMSIWFPGCVSPSNPQVEIPCDVRKGLRKVIGSQGQSPQEWDLCLKKRPHSAPLILSPGEDTRRL